MNLFEFGKGLVVEYLAYPAAERISKREVSSKLRALRKAYQMPFLERQKANVQRLAHIIDAARAGSPYYKELLIDCDVDGDKIRRDVKYLNDVPYLTKDILREQGERILTKPLAKVPHVTSPTGGSTGARVPIWYDHPARDWSASITRLSRESVGVRLRAREVHFASDIGHNTTEDALRVEAKKNFVFNRANVFYSQLDDAALSEILAQIKVADPMLVHGHPSTINALANFVARTQGAEPRLFRFFEASGELLEDKIRERVEQVFDCHVINRYGSAEFGIIAYQQDPEDSAMRVYDTEVWPETVPYDADGTMLDELVFTGLRNNFMPLIRYQTGDLGILSVNEQGISLTNMVGRMHDMIELGGKLCPTHYIMDVLQHRIGGIEDYQIDLREEAPVIRVVLEPHGNLDNIRTQIHEIWGESLRVQAVQITDLVLVGWRSKFRHVLK
jgi:phenylacetate-CoA ligase